MRSVNTPFSLTPILVGAAIIIALGYTAFVAFPFISGPTLSATLTKTAEGSYVISGTAEKVSSLWINDLPTPITEAGTFAVERTFPPGYTKVIVRAEDRFGRSRQEVITFVNTTFTYHAKESSTQESAEEDSRDASEGNEGGEESSN